MLNTKLDLKTVLNSLKGGDIKSFEIVYKNFSKHVYNYVLKIAKDEEQTLDIVQLTFIKIWNNKEHIDLDKSFQSYILQIANNLSIDYLRKIAKDEQKQNDFWKQNIQYGLSVEEDYILKEKAVLIDQFIDQLPTQQKIVFRMCKIEGYSYAEVADKLNLSTSTVSNHLTSAMKTIRILLNENKNELFFILFIINDLI